jgi:large subunit ribosomal protein L21
MYAVIKTGGKQYRVQPGDVMIVEKLDGDVGAAVKFDQVLAHGEGADVTLGAPVIDGAFVHATLIETRKGEKVKIFKKIRRKGYRRTRGHRQTETVLRVTGLEIGGKTTTWDGEVNLASKALLDAKARGLKFEIAALEGVSLLPAVIPAVIPAVANDAPKVKAASEEAVAENVVDTQEAAAEAPATPEAMAPKAHKAAPKKATAPETIDTVGTEADGVTEETVAPKKKAAPKAKPASDDAE